MQTKNNTWWNPWTGRYMRFGSTHSTPPAMRMNSARAARLNHEENTADGSRKALRKRRKIKHKIAKRSRRKNR